MNWKIVRSLIPIIGLWVIINYTKNLKEEYQPTKPIVKTTAGDLAWRFQVNEGDGLIGRTVQISGIATGVDSIYVVLDQRVFFSKDSSKYEIVKLGDEVQITARCANFNEEIAVLKIDHVNILNTQ